jgi:non-homologous end joining protein Ku
MAVRAYWKGSLKLSLVSCPGLLYPASTTSDKTRFPAKKAHRSAARARKAS